MHSETLLPNSIDTVVTGWTKSADTHNIFDATSGILTINRSGFLDLDAMITFAGPNATGVRSINIFYNNASAIVIFDGPGSSTTRTACSLSITGFPVNAGDTIRIRAFQTSGAGLALFNSIFYNSISWRIY